MLPASGRGVPESLALDHAPLTRMTPVGSFFAFVFCEKSPPLGGAACERADCAKASNQRNETRKIKEWRNAENIGLPQGCSMRQLKNTLERSSKTEPSS